MQIPSKRHSLQQKFLVCSRYLSTSLHTDQLVTRNAIEEVICEDSGGWSDGRRPRVWDPSKYMARICAVSLLMTVDSMNKIGRCLVVMQNMCVEERINDSGGNFEDLNGNENVLVSKDRKTMWVGLLRFRM